MESPFVWFDLRTKDPTRSRSFYEQLFDWDVADVPVGDGSASPVMSDPSPKKLWTFNP